MIFERTHFLTLRELRQQDQSFKGLNGDFTSLVHMKNLYEI